MPAQLKNSADCTFEDFFALPKKEVQGVFYVACFSNLLKISLTSFDEKLHQKALADF